LHIQAGTQTRWKDREVILYVGGSADRYRFVNGQVEEKASEGSTEEDRQNEIGKEE
jgi:hypothetical protein